MNGTAILKAAPITGAIFAARRLCALKYSLHHQKVRRPISEADDNQARRRFPSSARPSGCRRSGRLCSTDGYSRCDPMFAAYCALRFVHDRPASSSRIGSQCLRLPYQQLHTH